jgi:hypothetical protein
MGILALMVYYSQVQDQRVVSEKEDEDDAKVNPHNPNLKEEPTKLFDEGSPDDTQKVFSIARKIRNAALTDLS